MKKNGQPQSTESTGSASGFAQDSHRIRHSKQKSKPRNSKISTTPAASTVLSFPSIKKEESSKTVVRLIESIGPIDVKDIPRDRLRAPFGFWQEVVKIAEKMPPDQAIKIQLRDKAAYERVRSGLYKAAKLFGVGITLSRDAKTVFVERVIHVEKVVHSAR